MLAIDGALQILHYDAAPAKRRKPRKPADVDDDFSILQPVMRTSSSWRSAASQPLPTHALMKLATGMESESSVDEEAAVNGCDGEGEGDHSSNSDDTGFDCEHAPDVGRHSAMPAETECTETQADDGVGRGISAIDRAFADHGLVENSRALWLSRGRTVGHMEHVRRKSFSITAVCDAHTTDDHKCYLPLNCRERFLTKLADAV